MHIPAVTAAATAIALGAAPATASAAPSTPTVSAPAGVAPAGAPAALAASRGKTAPVPAGWRAYTVTRGDTLGYLAAVTGTTVRVLVDANHLPHVRALRAGQRIILPTHPTRTAPSAAAATPRTAPKTATPAPAPRPAATTPRTTTRPTVGPRYTRSQVGAMIRDVATRYGVDPHLARAIAVQESGWNQDARSVVGAMGVMQVMPANEAWLSQVAGRPLNLADTRDNVTAGVVLLRYLTTRAHSLDEAIGAYYQGLPSMRARGPYPDTRRYVSSVKALMTRY